MNKTPAQVEDLAPFTDALHFRPTIEAVVEHNVSRLRASGHPVATIKAVHSEPNAAKALMQVDWNLSSVWHVKLVSCLQPTSG